MPQGGRLSIETANVELDSKYASEHLGVTPGRYVMLAVTDTGEGMSREVQARLFEPFFTTKAVGKGTGMGLATVYGIVKQNHGYIWIYSELGQGTTVQVHFPAVLDGSAAESREIKSTLRLAGTETILVVEDNDRLRELTRRSLQRQGYTTLLASNGEEAVRIAGSHVGPIQLLLTDVVMPGLSGKPLVDAILRLRSDIKILYCSGYTADAIAHHGVVETGVAFLQKPFTPDGLAKKVREVLDA
jgi:CheY-like chemotaxis protein